MNGRLARKIRRKTLTILEASPPSTGMPYVRVNATGQVLLRPGSARAVMQGLKKIVKQKKQGQL